MQARGYLDNCLKYCWPKVIYCIRQPNKLKGEIKKKLGGQAKICGGHGPPNPPLKSPLAASKWNYRINHAHLHTVPNYVLLETSSVWKLRSRALGTLQSIERNQTRTVDFYYMISKDSNFSSYNYYSIPRFLHGQILFHLDNPDPNPVERKTISNPNPKKQISGWIGLLNLDPVQSGVRRKFSWGGLVQGHMVVICI